MRGLAEKVVKYRIENGLTREQISRQLGVSMTVINNIEYNPSWRGNIKTLRKIAAALGRTVAELEGENENVKASANDAPDVHALLSMPEIDPFGSRNSRKSSPEDDGTGADD